MRFPLILATMLALAAPVIAHAEIGRVKLATGDATIKRGTASYPAKPGFVLERGDTLVTGPKGRIGVTFSDNTRFAAGPNSVVAVKEFIFDRTTHDGRFVTSVDRGSLAIVSGQIAKKKKDAMRIKTPTSLLGVRGTRFVVDVG